jgi:hypothetical protein
MQIETIARTAHEANRVVQSILVTLGVDGGVPVAESWDEFPPDQQAGVIDGVEKALEGATPEQLHESWVEFKESDGWVYGPVKDVDAKTHPCLVAYEDLPPIQRAKDDLFSVIVRALTEGN